MSVWGKPVLLPRGGVTVTGDPAVVGAFGDNLASLSIYMALTQSGSGNPSPDNIRPIEAYTGAVITVIGPETGQTRTVNASWQTEAGKQCIGDVDVTGGSITPHRVYMELDGTEDWLQVNGSGSGKNYVRLQLPSMSWGSGASGATTCSHLVQSTSITSSNSVIGIRAQRGGDALPYLCLRKTTSDTVASIKAWLAEQYAAGTPVQVAYAITEAQRVPISITPHAVQTYNGVNTISANCGAVTPVTAGSKLQYIS